MLLAVVLAVLALTGWSSVARASVPELPLPDAPAADGGSADGGSESDSSTVIDLGEGYLFDPLGPSRPEQVPVVQQPNWWNKPVVDQIFGDALVGGVSPTVAVGGGRVFVAGSSADCYLCIFGYDATTLALEYRYAAGIGCEGSKVFSLAHYDGELYALVGRSGDQAGRCVSVVDPNTPDIDDPWAPTFRRSFVLVTDDDTPAWATSIDVAWGEVWVTAAAKSVVGYYPAEPQQVAVYDALTGAFKGTGPQFSDKPWIDLSIAPDLGGAFAGANLFKRLSAFAPGFGVTAPSECTFTFGPTNRLAHESIRCWLWRVGTDYVWGMRWLLTINTEISLRTVREYRVESRSPGPLALPVKNEYLVEAREWNPTCSAGCLAQEPVDIAYNQRDARIDWWGKPTSSDWLRATHQLNYAVSDADIFLAGKRPQRWYELARDFQKIELYVDGVLRESKIGAEHAIGNFQLNTANYASGSHRLELVATVAGKTLKIANDSFRTDNTPPTGTVTGLDQYSKGTVTIAGTATDEHAGAASWQLQVQRAGGSWQPVCTSKTLEAPVSAHACDWNTSNGQYPDGTYNVRARLVDRAKDAGNAGFTASPQTTVDNTAPTFTEPAPALGSDFAQAIDGDLTTVRFLQTDATAGIARTTLEYRPHGAGAAWEPANAPAATESGEASTSWSTAEVPPGLYDVRATTCDRAGNCKRSPYQVAVTARKRCPRVEGGLYRCYAGQAPGDIDFGVNTGGFGIRSSLETPGFIPKTKGFSASFVSIIGSSANSLEIGALNNACQSDYRNGGGGNWHAYARYLFTSEEARPCFSKLGKHTTRRYQVVNRKNSNGKVRGYVLMSPTPGGRLRVVFVSGERKSHWLGKGYGFLGAQAETNVHGRDVGGFFTNLRYQGRKGGPWKVPSRIDRLDSGQGYKSEYVDPANLCVHGPHRGCTPKSG